MDWFSLSVFRQLSASVGLTSIGQDGGIEMTRWASCEAVESHPEKLGGALIFRGTRVPVSALFENIKDGASVSEFLEWFPGVEDWQVRAVLEHEVMDLERSGNS